MTTGRLAFVVREIPRDQHQLRGWRHFRYCERFVAQRLAVLLLLTVLTARAAQQGDFSYEDYGGESITITGYTGKGGAVAIPETIAGKPVSWIGDDAFEGCTGLTNLI